MAVPMSSLGNSLLDAHRTTEFAAIPSGAVPVVVTGYTRATKSADGTYLTWQSTTTPDLLMVDAPGGLDPLDYEDFVVVR